MDIFSRSLVIVVVLVHLTFFALEAVFWMDQRVNTPLLHYLGNPVAIDYPTQALALKSLFVNQGSYNLCLAVMGIAGLSFETKGLRMHGYFLMLTLAFCAVIAGVVLACTTTAYALAAMQGGPAVIVFLRVLRLYRKF